VRPEQPGFKTWRADARPGSGCDGLRAWQGLLDLAQRFPIIDVRGRGLMVAAEFGEPGGGLKAPYGLAAKITKACGKRNMILLSAGAHSRAACKCDCPPALRWPN